jgi:penicillin-binding protein 1A
VSGGNLPTEVWHNFMKIALKDQTPVGLLGVAGVGQASRYDNAGESGRGQPQRRTKRQKNFFEKLFGL